MAGRWFKQWVPISRVASRPLHWKSSTFGCTLESPEQLWKMPNLGPYSRPIKQTLEEGPGHHCFWGCPSNPEMEPQWSHSYTPMMVYLQVHQGYLGIVLPMYINFIRLEFRTLWMRNLFDKEHKEVGSICCSLLVSRCAPCDFFEERVKIIHAT